MKHIKFGLELPGFSSDGSTKQQFLNKITSFLDGLEGSFDSIWVWDHFHPWGNWVNRSSDVWECLTTISYLSAIYKSYDFGSFVLCNNYRNPALVAKMGATIGTLTKGRFVLGIGAGWYKDEYPAYGYEFQSPKIRVDQLEETLQIIRKMWTEDPANFQGEYYRIANAYCNPKPDPITPIMIGGKGSRMLKLVAKYADWWNTGNCTVEAYTNKWNELREQCSKVNREFKDICKTYGTNIAIAQTEKEAFNRIKRTGYPCDSRSFIGTPERIIEKIKSFIDIGVKYFIFGFVDAPNLDGAKLFADEVIPKFQQ